MKIELKRSFALDHPSAAGHFPGNPIIPGAVLLDAVVEAIVEALGHPIAVYTIKSAKFLRPIRPGDAIVVQLDGLGGGDIRFDCKIADETVLSGIWTEANSQTAESSP